MLFDTHAHFAAFDNPSEVVARASSAGVTRILCVSGVTEADIFAPNLPGVYLAVAVHPHDAKDFMPDVLSRLSDVLSTKNAVALGEIGLDYHYDFSPRDVQMSAFEAQLALAYDMNLPVILHIREAHGDAIDMLRGTKNRPRGVMHCYSGSKESARDYMNMGFDISFTGVVTFKNAARIREVAAYIPKGRIMVETDCPYMSPEPHRGKTCEPAFVYHTAACLAALRNESLEDFAAHTTNAAIRLFGIKS